MKNNIHSKFSKVFAATIFLILLSTVGLAHTSSSSILNNTWLVNTITAQAPNLRTTVLRKALLAYEHAQHKGLDRQKILTIIDYSLPSVDKRLWVINLNNYTVEYHTFVAQGEYTGFNYAKHFSNKPGSRMSSLGVFLTGRVYNGKHPHSLRLRGLEPGFNNNAYRREIVIHPAWYVSRYVIDNYKHLGRSWGCFALNPKVEPFVVDTIKDGSILIAYYPEKKWLETSAFLKPLSA